MNAEWLNKIYAGFLGMNIGIRLGAPVESGFWTYNRLRDIYGDIRGYVRPYKHFAADDDANGPVFFLRALDDHDGEPTPEAVAEAWLNYAREGVGLYWWGGYGISTEHTAYQNLKHGVPAPRSGSIEQNGRTLAEQIGGQIFIDTWGLIAPADPARAARYARVAASVSHDGEGLHGAAFIAACISAAFNGGTIQAVMDKALEQIPSDSLYAAVVRAVRAFHADCPDDWRACRDMLNDQWGYDRYGGVCHIIPNAGVCALALCYGGGDFARTVEIATMCGWDTDCNAGNVGTILGVLCGLDGLPEHYRTPINDEIVLSGISGYLNILDIPTYAKRLYAQCARLRGEPGEMPAPVDGEIDFDFSLPGNTHGFRFESNCPEYSVRPAQTPGYCVLVDFAVRGGKRCSLHYKPFWRRADFDDERYMPVFSPTAYPGQTARFTLAYECMAGDALLVTPYVRETYTKRTFEGQPVLIHGGTRELDMVIPCLDGGIADEIGLIIASIAQPKLASCGLLRLVRFQVSGKASYDIELGKSKTEFGSVLPFSHNHGAWTVENGQLLGMALDGAESMTGNYYMTDARLRCDVTPLSGDNHWIGLRVQGARRGVYAGLTTGGSAAILVREKGVTRVLAETRVAWAHNQRYTLMLTIQGSDIELTVDGASALRASCDTLKYGMASLYIEGMGRCAFDRIHIQEI